MTDLGTGTHDVHDRRPTWSVQSVYDPDGEGKDFAYTVGLDDLGHPELHIWARPALGDDPGDDWMFSPTDRCHVLNQLAWQLIDGAVGVGSEVVRDYDDGAATVRFRIDPPGDVEELEAYGVAAGALVLPVRWSLHREPEGAPRALRAGDIADARVLRRTILTDLDPTRRAPAGWEVGARASWRRDQRWGPLTPVVLARAAQLWQADSDALSWLVGNAVDIGASGSLTWPVTIARAAARRSGRRAEVARLEDDVVAMVRNLRDAAESAPRWEALKSQIWGGPISDPDEDEAASDAITRRVTDAALACLTVEAVADVIDPQVLLHGRGAWSDAFETHDDLEPGRCSSDAVVDVVRRLLVPLTTDDLGWLARRHAAARDGDGDYAEVAMKLRGWTLTGPAGCPWRPTIGEVPSWRDDIAPAAAFLGPAARPHDDLRAWCSSVTCVLTYRGRLAADEVHTFSRPFVDVLPRLEEVLNQPVTTLAP